MIKHKKILITGGGGFIGSWLSDFFSKNNQVTIFDNGRRNAFQFLPEKVKQNIIQVTGDILDKKALSEAMKGQDIILHLAAIAGASSYEQNPLLTLQVNLQGTINILDQSSITLPQHIILFSSSEVYGATAHNVEETNATSIGTAYQSRWSYAISKLASDHYGLSAFKKNNLPITIVRPFNVYGPRQVGEGAVSNMLKSFIEEGSIKVTGKGNQKRSWCYITDFIDAIAAILERKVYGEIFNIGNPNEYCSVQELAEKIQSLTGAKITHTKAVQSEIIDRLPNINHARKILKFKPAVTLDQGLEQTYQWFREINRS